MRNVGVVVVLAGVAVGVGGCNSSTTSIPLADLQSRVAEETCEVNVQCGSYPDVPTCQAATASSLAPVMADVSAGMVKYDGQAAAVCLNAFEHAAGNCRQSAEGRTAMPPACENMFVGSVAEGGACLHDEECVSGRCDRTACDGNACCQGACVPGLTAVRTTAAGAACTSNDECVTGTFCALGTTTPVCTPSVATGQPCGANVECAIGEACIVTPSSEGTAVCADPPETGEPCAGLGTCDHATDFCDPTSLTCLHRFAVGAVCDPSADECVPYAFCDASAVCVARGAVGVACDPAVTPSTCLAGLTCDAGACALPPADPTCPSP